MSAVAHFRFPLILPLRVNERSRQRSTGQDYGAQSVGSLVGCYEVDTPANGQHCKSKCELLAPAFELDSGIETT